jgi:hypothetical protein
MPVFPCEHCGGAYELADADVGSTVVCPHCQQETASVAAPQESGAATMARDLTERMQAEQASRRLSPFMWLVPVSALFVTALVHVIMVVIYMTLKPMPNVLVFWLPAVVGVLVGLNLFTMFTRSSNVDCPKWATPAAVAIAVVLSIVPILIVQQKYNMKVRRALIAQVDARLKPPSLPSETAACVNASIPESTGDDKFTFSATLKDGSKHRLVCSVALYNADLIYEQSMKSLQLKLAKPHVEKSLEKCLAAYPHLGLLEMDPVNVKETPKTGEYTGEAVYNTTLRLAYEARVRKDSMSCSLTSEADLRARALPLASELWERFEPASTEACIDVKLGDSIDDTHRQADAILSNDQSIPIIIKQDESGDNPLLSVFFQFRETAIMEINAALKAAAEADGRDVVQRCVNIDQKQPLRDREFSLRAIFPEGEPLKVLATKNAYEVGIVTGKHELMLASGERRADTSWSLLVPADYIPREGSEFMRSRESETDKLNIQLETKPINAYAKFDLNDYAVKERTEWEQGHQAADIEPVEAWETTSGLSGYRYATRKDAALRIKYFFTRGTNLAIVSALSTEAVVGVTDRADTIAKTLRFKDVADEKAATAE